MPAPISFRLFSSISLPLPVPVPIVPAVEIEHVEEVADRRHVDGDVGVVVVGARVGQVVAAALAELAEQPVALDEFHER